MLQLASLNKTRWALIVLQVASLGLLVFPTHTMLVLGSTLCSAACASLALLPAFFTDEKCIGAEMLWAALTYLLTGLLERQYCAGVFLAIVWLHAYYKCTAISPGARLGCWLGTLVHFASDAWLPFLFGLCGMLTAYALVTLFHQESSARNALNAHLMAIHLKPL